MRDILFPFQEAALSELHTAINDAHVLWRENKPQVVSFSAPTGSGKTIIMTALFEEIFNGYAGGIGDPDAVFIWLSDSPELNEQTRLKIEGKSDRIRTSQLIVIDSSFDAEYLEGGNVYFLNTQKLGSEKLLTQEGDDRTYKIWQTIENTAKRIPKKLYVVIDEAHRGTYTSTQAENRAQSIMQKFIMGSAADGLSPMPLVIGVTATPLRLEKLLASATSTVQKVIVPPEQVRESGLLKDRIILHYPDIALNADMTMFQGAVENWRTQCDHWKVYCEREQEKPIKPILVVQVEDGNDRVATHTDIGVCLELLEESLGRKLLPDEVVHTFNDHGTITVREVEIRKIEASRIEEDETAIVVFFKMNLSTGWDCPRAETMMSFRHAQDYTYIAQLLGRMIRTPLARRISSDAELNNVSLFLPYFDSDTVKNVVNALRDSEAILTTETGTAKELVSLKRNLEYLDVFKAMDNLITYRIDSTRRQSALRLYMQISRALTMDAIDFTAWRLAKQAVISMMSREIQTMKETGTYDAKVAELTGFNLEKLTFEYGENLYVVEENTNKMILSDFDISRHFERAGKQFGEGLHVEYWRAKSNRNHIDVKIDVIVLANNIDSKETLENFANCRFLELYETNKRAIALLSEVRRNVYEKMVNSATRPIAILWELPNSIDFNIGEENTEYSNHLFVQHDGSFRATLNSWEDSLINEEFSNGMVCWLRNLDRKSWALEIPYEVAGITVSMFPDLIVVRADARGYVFDILEPHDPSRKDNYPKAVGLAKFSEQHWASFGKIQLVRKQRGVDGRDHFYRLDMSKVIVRNIVRGITSNEELDRVFDDLAERED